MSDSPGQAVPVALSSSERWVVVALSSAQCLLFGWAGHVLPWADFSMFSLCAFALALAHGATALTLAAGRYAELGVGLWKCGALAALAFLTYVSFEVFSGGAYLAGLYGSLGEGLFAALVAVWGLFVLVTLPTACWALVRGREHAPRLGRLPWFGGAGLVLAVGASALGVRAWASVAQQADSDDISAALAELATGALALPPARPAGGRAPEPISHLGAVRCPAPPGAGEQTWVATYPRRDGRGFDTTCVQAKNGKRALLLVAKRLRKRAARGQLLLDRIWVHAPLAAFPAWTRPFAVRPGLDGACAGKRCALPWQLLVRDALVEYRPLSFIQDLRFGVDLKKLGKWLGASAQGPLLRVTTTSWMLAERGFVQEERLRPKVVSSSPQAIARSAELLRRHLLSAQLPSGKFRYKLQPFSGKAETRSFDLARQAGTVLVLCQLGGNGPGVDDAIRSGLAVFERHEHRSPTGAVAGLSRRKSTTKVWLNDSVLPLVALLTCRTRMGTRFDPLVTRLARLVLATQRSDGGFDPGLDLDHTRALHGPEPLYAPGQAILALALLEQLAPGAPDIAPVPVPELERARQAAMTFTAQRHWPSSLRPFFFVEENWHCLAARAGLSLPRNDGYERFCLDYIAFRSRFILEEDSDVDPAFVGGLGFGNVIPPHNTGAAGFGEALAAATFVLQRRGESRARQKALLSKVMTFLERQQWTEQNCIGCVPEAIGAISEHTHSPITRIDFAQHALAALGHGAEALAL